MAILRSLAFTLALTALGTALILESIRLRRAFGWTWMRFYSIYLAAFFLAALINEALPSLFWTSLNLSPNQAHGVFLIPHLFFATPLYVAAFFSFNRFMAGFSARKISRGIAIAYFCGVGIYLTALSWGFVRSMSRGSLNAFWSNVESFSAWPVIFVFLIHPAWLAIRAQGSANRVRAVRVFMAAHASGLTAYGLLYAFVPVNEAHDFVRYIFNLPTLLILSREFRRWGERPCEPLPSESRIESGLFGDEISNRELEVIRLVCEGKSNHEISKHLFISIHTVKQHLYRIYQKLGIRNRVQLVNTVQAARSRPGGSGGNEEKIRK